jgi:formate dehydrogenase maturation protein FdhE
MLVVSNSIYEWYLTRRCPNCGNRLETIVIFDRHGGDHYFKCSVCQAEFRLSCYKLSPNADSPLNAKSVGNDENSNTTIVR